MEEIEEDDQLKKGNEFLTEGSEWFWWVVPIQPEQIESCAHEPVYIVVKSTKNTTCIFMCVCFELHGLLYESGSLLIRGNTPD